MNPSAWATSFITLPTIITEPGDYITRSGERVTIHSLSGKYVFNCLGMYSTGESEGWHKTGRIMFGSQTANDIVKAA